MYTAELSVFKFQITTTIYEIRRRKQRNCSGFSLLSPLCSPLARLHAEWLPGSGH